MLQRYASYITEQAGELQQLSNVLCVDAYFSKRPFIDAILARGMHVVSRLQKNSYLRYASTAEKSSRRGRPRVYDGKVNVRSLDMRHCELIASSPQQAVYQAIVHVKSLQRWCKIVVLQTLKEGTITNVQTYVATDTTMAGEQILSYYGLRFQIEFLFRDAKNFTGLHHCQSRTPQAMEYHYNISLTALNVAKVLHWIKTPQQERGTFSMADITKRYANRFLLDSIISIYGKDPNLEINNPQIQQLYNLGTIAA